MGTIDPVLHTRRLLEERAELIATADECMDRLRERLAAKEAEIEEVKEASDRAAHSVEQRCNAMIDERHTLIEWVRRLEAENAALRAAQTAPPSSLGG